MTVSMIIIIIPIIIIISSSSSIIYNEKEGRVAHLDRSELQREVQGDPSNSNT